MIDTLQVTFKYHMTAMTAVSAIRAGPFISKQAHKWAATISTRSSNNTNLFEIYKMASLSTTENKINTKTIVTEAI